MYYLFLICAVLGGTIFVIQFLMTVFGLGLDNLEIPHDLNVDTFDHGEVADHGSTWLFGVISFRTLTAAMAFFGLAGLGALESNQGFAVAMLVALIAAATALICVHLMMQSLFRLKKEGSIGIEQSVGRRGTTYIPIPPHKAGAGKIQMKVHNCLKEYRAMTDEPSEICTGTPIEVVDVISPNTVEVRTARKPSTDMATAADASPG
jgi:membrane protein implicated in regulation of membrane protease activity